MSRAFAFSCFLQSKRNWVCLALLGGVTLFYCLSFKFLYVLVSSGATALSILLVLLAAWMFGLRGGLLAGPLTVLLNLSLLAVTGQINWIAMWQNGGAMGSVVLLLTGIVVGKISDLMSKSQRTELVLRQQLSINRSLAELATALISQHSLEEVAALVLAHMQELTNSPYGYVACVDPDSGQLYGLKLNGPAGENVPMLVEGLLQKIGAIQSFQKQRVPLVWDEEMLDGSCSLNVAEEVKIWRLLAAPAFLEDALVGMVVVFNAAQPYLAESQELSQKLASLYAIAIQKHRIERKYQYMSLHDGLTGLYNRVSFEEELHRLEQGGDFPVGLVMIDVDGLKQINDTYGHSAGDILLQRMAQVLRSSFRAKDLIARIGGDEFAVLLPSTNYQTMKLVVERIRSHQMDHNRNYPGLELEFSLGAAVAVTPQELWSALTEADAAMYEDKSAHEKKTSLPG
jgi:diguanylate cyclase (GGDEF)-like protein